MRSHSHKSGSRIELGGRLRRATAARLRQLGWAEKFGELYVESVRQFQERSDAGVCARGLDTTERIQVEVSRFSKVLLRHTCAESTRADVGGDGTKDADETRRRHPVNIDRCSPDNKGAE